jgi:hypothetical protein
VVVREGILQDVFRYTIELRGKPRARRCREEETSRPPSEAASAVAPVTGRTQRRVVCDPRPARKPKARTWVSAVWRCSSSSVCRA